MKKTYIFVLAMMLMVFFVAFPQSHDKAAVVEAAAVTTQEAAVELLPEPEPEKEVEGQTEPPQVQAQSQAQQEQLDQETPAETMAEEEVLYREGLAAYITSVNDTVTDSEALAMVDCILEQAEQYQMDEKLIMAVAQTESTYYSDAVSCANYKGLMQTGDVLAEEAGYSPEDLFNPEVSIAVGAGYIDDQLETFGDVQLALAAYNQGPGAVYDGSYSTGYADLTLKRVENIEAFLLEEGYL